jgi:folate-binding protein YgfZ
MDLSSEDTIVQSPPTSAASAAVPVPASQPVVPGPATARQSVMALEEGGAGTLVVTGGDRLTWLNGLVTCDLARRVEGDATYGLVVGRTGKVMADAIIATDETSVYLTVPGAAVEALRAHLDHHLVMEDAELLVGEGFETWLLHGPRSAEILRVARDAGALGGAFDRTGLGGAIVIAPKGRAAQVREAIVRAVAAERGAIGDAADWEALRLERGVARFGVDFGEKTYPQEAALEKVAVSFNKGCYLGQEVVCMVELRGHVKRKLVPVVFDAPVAPPRGSEVVDEAGAALGELTSAVISPTLGVGVGLAMVKRSHSEPGSVVKVAGSRAKVVDRPA